MNHSAPAHGLNVLHTPDEACLARLRERNADGKLASAATDDRFHCFSRQFVPPSPEEGFALVPHRHTA